VALTRGASPFFLSHNGGDPPGPLLKHEPSAQIPGKTPLFPSFSPWLDLTRKPLAFSPPPFHLPKTCRRRPNGFGLQLFSFSPQWKKVQRLLLPSFLIPPVGKEPPVVRFDVLFPFPPWCRRTTICCPSPFFPSRRLVLVEGLELRSVAISLFFSLFRRHQNTTFLSSSLFVLLVRSHVSSGSTVLLQSR